MIHEINLEINKPEVVVALRSLEFFIANVRVQNEKVIKIIHGYGSSGRGGKIRSATRKMLKEYKDSGKITLLIKGEKFSIFDPSTRYLIEKCPETANDPDLNNGNMGITYIML